MPDLNGQQLGQYELVDLLGEGGMATVYRAHQRSMKRDVAVKVIESRLARNPEFVARFEREAQTVAALSHPHILKVFDYGIHENDIVYLVMELLSGGSLADRIRRQPLDFETTAELLDQIARALDYAHRQGIVHRDLKPQNVLLDASGNALLTDFGIAKILTETTALTQSGAIMGTPAYMAPEQWQGMPVDGRTDLYALGVILFEMLSGRIPFKADTPFAMMHKHTDENPPTLSGVRADVPPVMDHVLSKALAKNPADRYESAAALSAAFKAALVTLSPANQKMAAATPITRETKPLTNDPTVIAPLTAAPPPAVPLPAAPLAHSRRPLLLVVAGVAGVVIVLGVLFSVLAPRLTLTASPTIPSPRPTLLIAMQITNEMSATPLPTPTNMVIAAAQVPSTNTLQPATPTIVIPMSQVPTLVIPATQVPSTNTLQPATPTIVIPMSQVPTLVIPATQVPATNAITLPAILATVLRPTEIPSLTPTAIVNPTSVDTAAQALTVRVFNGHTQTVNSVAFSPDGRTILTGSDDTTAKLWNAQSGALIRTLSGHAANVTAVAFSPDGRYALTASWDQTAILWDVSTGMQVRAFTGAGTTLYSVAFAPDGKTILTGGEDTVARLWDVASGDHLRIFAGHAYQVNGVAFAPDGKTILTGSGDNTAKLWDITTGKLLRTFSGPDQAVNTAVFSPDGRYVVTSSDDMRADLWDTTTSNLIRSFSGHTKGVNSAVFSPDGRFILTASADHTAKLWNTQSGKLLYTFTGHTDSVTSAVFSPDGKVILTGSADKTARLWIIPASVLQP